MRDSITGRWAALDHVHSPETMYDIMSKRDRRIQALIRAHGTSIRRRVKTPPASTTVQECASQWPADPSGGRTA